MRRVGGYTGLPVIGRFAAAISRDHHWMPMIDV
jgi:hypothetical protein